MTDQFINTGNIVPKPFFIEGVAGGLFCTFFCPPKQTAKKQVVLVAPFAEELNRCRYLLARQARLWAENGHPCLLLDLYGSGDSDGDFEQARWSIWLQDINTAVEWLSHNNPASIVLWGVRLGALLAVEYAVKHRHACLDNSIILWDPVLDGAQYIDQFLLLRVIRNKFAGNSESLAMLKQLAASSTVEIAGYKLHSSFVNTLTTACLQDLVLPPQSCVFLSRIQVNHDMPMPRPMDNLRLSWQKHGVIVNIRKLVGPKYWEILEQTQLPLLHEYTIAALT